MHLNCLSCALPIAFRSSDAEVQCTNRGCHAPYRFRIFRDLDEAAEYLEQVGSWRTKHLIPVTGRRKTYFAVGYFNQNITPYRIFSISSLIGTEILQAIQAGSADNLGGPLTVIEIEHCDTDQPILRRIEPLSYAYRPSVPPHMRRFTDFCSTLRVAGTGAENGDTLCVSFDYQIVREYLNKPPYASGWHYCWCHLVDYIVPLMVHGQIVGVLFSGQRRMDDPVADAELEDCVTRAATKIGVEPELLLRLARSPDVKKVKSTQIERDLRRLEQVAHRLEAEAYGKYTSERQVREGYFLEELASRLADVAHCPLESEILIWDQMEDVLRRILEFVGCYHSIALLREISPGSREFAVVASYGDVIRTFQEVLDANLVRELPAPQSGATLTTDCHQLSTDFSGRLVPYDIDIGCALSMPLTSGRHLVLVLSSPKHQCRYRASTGFCEQTSAPCRRFISHLGNRLAAELDIVLYAQDAMAAEKRKESFLIRTAHTLSLPMQSIIADSANLVTSAQSNCDASLYDTALHNLNAALELDLVVQNILRLAPQSSDQFGFTYEPVPVHEVLHEACSMFQGEAREKGCDISVSLVCNEVAHELHIDDLASPLLMYNRLIMEPLKSQLGIPADRLLTKKDVSVRIISSGRENPSQIEDVAMHCAKLQIGHDLPPVRVVLGISGRQVEIPGQEIAKFHMPPIEMIRDEVTLALKNLIQNAVKYSFRARHQAEPRYVQVRCQLIDHRRCYRISVWNYGVGILPHELESGKIWSAGYRGVLSRDRNRLGAGLGLNQVKVSIEGMHGGSASAMSIEQPGGAFLTSFVIMLPVRQVYRRDRRSTYGYAD